MGKLYFPNQPSLYRLSACTVSFLMDGVFSEKLEYIWLAHWRTQSVSQIEWLPLVGKRETSISSDHSWNGIYCPCTSKKVVLNESFELGLHMLAVNIYAMSLWQPHKGHRCSCTCKISASWLLGYKLAHSFGSGIFEAVFQACIIFMKVCLTGPKWSSSILLPKLFYHKPSAYQKGP
jgi:hypothetical protein